MSIEIKETKIIIECNNFKKNFYDYIKDLIDNYNEENMYDFIIKLKKDIHKYYFNWVDNKINELTDKQSDDMFRLITKIQTTINKFYRDYKKNISTLNDLKHNLIEIFKN